MFATSVFCANDIVGRADSLAEPDPVHGMRKDSLGSDMSFSWGMTHHGPTARQFNWPNRIRDIRPSSTLENSSAVREPRPTSVSPFSPIHPFEISACAGKLIFYVPGSL
jgi:hypothetical protein